MSWHSFSEGYTEWTKTVKVPYVLFFCRDIGTESGVGEEGVGEGGLSERKGMQCYRKRNWIMHNLVFINGPVVESLQNRNVESKLLAASHL